MTLDLGNWEKMKFMWPNQQRTCVTMQWKQLHKLKTYSKQQSNDYTMDKKVLKKL